MTTAAFDFRKPPPGELERQVGRWLLLAARQAMGIWARILPYPTEVKPGPVTAVTAALGLNALTDDALGLPLTTPDAADGTILLSFQRPVCLGLLAGLLGETPILPPVDRGFTDLEASLLDYLARELFLNPLEKGWPGSDAPAFTAGSVGQPRAVWRIPGGDAIMLGTLVVATPFGEYPVYLLVPRRGRFERLGEGDPRGKPVPPAPRAQLEAIVREMPVEVDVVLGAAELTMYDLTQLKAGDLVVLRQKVTQPLDGLVAGARKFRVWPGVVGTRVAAQIHAPVEGAA